MKHTFERYCKNYQSIENYEKALADNFKGWHCHHRLETHTSDGERRLVDIPQKELIALNMYYHRPPEELIFLPRSEHEAYRKGKPRSAETRKKLSIANKGEKNPMYGKHLSEEHKKQISSANKGNTYAKGKPVWNKGKKTSEETRKKISEGNKGKQAGEKHPMYGKKHSDEAKKKMREARKGKYTGEKHPMYGKHHSEESKKKMREAMKGNKNNLGKHWYNNGKENKFCYECPEGFVPGHLR